LVGWGIRLYNKAMPILAIANSSITLSSLSLVVTILTAAATGIVFLVVRVFNLGKVSNRLEVVEKDIKAVKREVKEIRGDVNARIDEVLQLLAAR